MGRGEGGVSGVFGGSYGISLEDDAIDEGDGDKSFFEMAILELV